MGTKWLKVPGYRDEKIHSLYDAHDLTDMVEDEILEAYPNAQIIIHQDPAGIDEKRLDQIILQNKKKKKKS